MCDAYKCFQVAGKKLATASQFKSPRKIVEGYVIVKADVGAEVKVADADLKFFGSSVCGEAFGQLTVSVEAGYAVTVNKHNVALHSDLGLKKQINKFIINEMRPNGHLILLRVNNCTKSKNEDSEAARMKPL